MTKRTTLIFALVALMLCANGVYAQNTEKPHKLSRFLTVDFIGGFSIWGNSLNKESRPENRYGVSLGYEHYLNPRLSVVSELRYINETKKSGGFDYAFNSIGFSLGLRYRIIQLNRLNFYGEGRVGYAHERFLDENTDRLSSSWNPFAEVGLGAEYMISDRLKGTLGVSGGYSGRYGITPTMRLGFQMKLGR